MHYIIFDLEFNQGYNFRKEPQNVINPKCPFEIIQIGALKLDENFNTVSTLDLLVKPEVYPVLNPYVKELTGITMEELDSGKSFKEMYKEFIEFIKADRSVLCVWGVADIKELFRNMEYHELNTSLVPTEYINIQACASKVFDCQRGINIGLGPAAKLLNIPIKSEFHNAFNDAYYTTEVFKKIYTKEIKTNKYNPYKSRRVNKSDTQKHKIDTISLLKQFEKMFNREITADEKSMIKLAYIMGKTNRFHMKVVDDVVKKK